MNYHLQITCRTIKQLTHLNYMIEMCRDPHENNRTYMPKHMY